ncbi:MAG: GNAT family N-acetyltransferase [Elusimicrobia bacterium]|nr:GNAT family N-acetyltransferase [Elusimicrobiota bacterium]
MVKYRFIRRPNQTLLRQITEIYRGEGWWVRGDTPALLRRIISRSRLFIIAEEDGRAVGMARAIDAWSREVYIHDVAVLRPYRGRKIGSGLLTRLVSRLRSGGVRWMGLIASGGAEAFYRPLGFRSPPGAAAMTRGTPNV